MIIKLEGIFCLSFPTRIVRSFESPIENRGLKGAEGMQLSPGIADTDKCTLLHFRLAQPSQLGDDIQHVSKKLVALATQPIVPARHDGAEQPNLVQHVAAWPNQSLARL